MKNNTRIHYGWIILVLAVAAVGGAPGLARFGYTITLPAMKSGLSSTDSQLGDLATESGGANVPMIGVAAAWFAGSRRGFTTGIAVTFTQD